MINSFMCISVYLYVFTFHVLSTSALFKYVFYSFIGHEYIYCLIIEFNKKIFLTTNSTITVSQFIS